MLLLMCSQVQAEEWFEAPNNGGGKILLLTGFCGRNDSGKNIIAMLSTGESFNGCWYYFADMVHVVWSDGTTSSYDPLKFTKKVSK